MIRKSFKLATRFDGTRVNKTDFHVSEDASETV